VPQKSRETWRNRLPGRHWKNFAGPRKRLDGIGDGPGRADFISILIAGSSDGDVVPRFYFLPLSVDEFIGGLRPASHHGTNVRAPRLTLAQAKSRDLIGLSQGPVSWTTQRPAVLKTSAISNGAADEQGVQMSS